MGRSSKQKVQATEVSKQLTPVQQQRYLRWYNRKYVVDAHAQFKIILLLAGISLVFSTAICCIAYFWLVNLRPFFDQSIIPPVAPPEAFQMIANALMYRLMAINIVMFMVFLVTGILLTHRMVGPIWKIQNELKKFLSGAEILQIRFRKGDEFQELPQLINLLVKGYKGPRNLLFETKDDKQKR